MYILTHHDDGKGNGDSHVVTVTSNTNEVDFGVCGYGETKAEALKFFILGFQEIMSVISGFAFHLENDRLELLEVDGLGDPIIR